MELPRRRANRRMTTGGRRRGVGAVGWVERKRNPSILFGQAHSRTAGYLRPPCRRKGDVCGVVPEQTEAMGFAFALPVLRAAACIGGCDMHRRLSFEHIPP